MNSFAKAPFHVRKVNEPRKGRQIDEHGLKVTENKKEKLIKLEDNNVLFLFFLAQIEESRCSEHVYAGLMLH